MLPDLTGVFQHGRPHLIISGPTGGNTQSSCGPFSLLLDLAVHPSRCEWRRCLASVFCSHDPSSPPAQPPLHPNTLSSQKLQPVLKGSSPVLAPLPILATRPRGDWVGVRTSPPSLPQQNIWGTLGDSEVEVVRVPWPLERGSCRGTLDTGPFTN